MRLIASWSPGRLEVQGEAVIVVEEVGGDLGTGTPGYAVADNGTLIYQRTGAGTRTLGWINRVGEMTTALVEGRGLLQPRLSPDGTRMAFRSVSPEGNEAIWIRDLASGRDTKLTETGDVNQSPTWHPDGSVVTFVSDRGDGIQLYSRPIDLSGETELVRATDGTSVPGSWTPDGQTLVYYEVNNQDDRDIWILPVGGDPVPFLATEFNERAPRLSPNGRWLAYVSDQTGQDRIHVQAFPDGGPVTTVSVGRGSATVWSRDGRELFYRTDNQLWAVPVETESAEFVAGTSRLLFDGNYRLDDSVSSPSYDVSLDGQQFLAVRDDTEAAGLIIVQNWFQELTDRVPLP